MKIKQRTGRPGAGQLVVTVPTSQKDAVESAIATLESTYGMKGSPAVVQALLEAATAAKRKGNGRTEGQQQARAVRPGLEADLDAIDEFAGEVSAAWKDDMSATDAVREQRREL